MRLEFPGSLYADSLPSGEWAVLNSASMRTHLGDLDLPPGDYPLYHCITMAGGFQMAGQGHDTAVTWHWKAGQWLRQPLCNGVNGAIFDLNGALHIIPPAPNATSQGFRYVAPDGRLVLGDDTKGPKFGLSEYIDLSDSQDGRLLIGQGHEQSGGPKDGCHVRIKGQLREIQPGFCQFIRARLHDELVSIAMWTRRLSDDHPEGGALLLWLMIHELEQLPLSTLSPTDHIEPVNRDMWLGWYEFAKPDQPPPGNCIVACDPIGDVPVSGLLTLPTIVATSRPVTGPVIGKYCVGSIEDIERQARETSHRAVAYWDSTRRWPRLPNLPDNAWLCVKAYCLKTETPHSFERDVAAYVTELSPRQVAVVCQCYTNNTDHTTDLASLVPVYARLAKLPNVVALLVFSDAGRKTGLNQNPDVRPLWQFVANSIRPPRLDVVVNHPTFTISEPRFPLSADVDPGGAFSFRCVVTLEAGAGEPDWIEWLWSKDGPSGPWTVAVRNPGFDKDHTFHVKPGTYWFGAMAGNAAGRHQTGAERKVTVTLRSGQPQPQPQPDPAPQPQPQPTPQPAGDPVAIKTHGGQFLKVGEGLVVDARALTEQDATKFVLTRDGSTATLSANGKFAHAVNGGAGKLIANKTAVAAHETFTFARKGAGFTLQAERGQFVCAEGGGGGDVNVNRTAGAEWETFTGPTFGPVITPRTGRVRAENRCFADDGGPFNALAASLFWGLSGYRDRRDAFDANVTFLAEHGFHAYRVMSELGPPLFSDRVADPNAGDYDTSLTGMVDHAYDDLGLRTQLVIFGGTDYNRTMPQREAHVDRIARLLQGREHKIHFVEIVNEGWQTFGGSLEEIKRLAKRLKSQLNVLVATTDSPDWDAGHEQTYGDSGATVSTVHVPRDQWEEGWRAVRQPWEARGAADPSLMANDEPVGPESSVAQDRDSMRLVMSAVVTYISGLSQYTLHTGAGVTGGNGQDGHARTTVNVFDYPEVRTAAEGYHAMATYLPPDLANWTKQNWHWGGHPFSRSMEGQNWPNDHGGRGVVNDYGAMQGNQFVTAPSGLKGHYDVKARASMAFDVIHPLTGDVLQHVTLSGGQSHRLEGLTAFVLTGQFT